MNRKLKTAAFIEKLPAFTEQEKRAHLEWKGTPASKLADELRKTMWAASDYDAWRVYSLLGYIKGGTKDRKVLSAINEALALFQKRIPFCKRFEKAMNER